MKARQFHFSAQLRRYRHTAKKVARLLKAGHLALLSGPERKRLLQKLRTRLERIGHLVPQTKLAGSLAAIGLLLGTAFDNPIQAQNFAPVVANPFGIPEFATTGYVSFADIDGDGDLDLCSNGYEYGTGNLTFYFFENTGTATNPQFSQDNFEVNPFGISPSYLAMPNFVDMDADGDLDLLSGIVYGGGFQYQENIGSATAPLYTAPQSNPFGLIASPPVDFATVVDLDGDGDTDVVSNGINGTVRFFENTGTVAAPDFAAPVTNPFGIDPVALVTVPTFGDYDGDGDYDLIYLNYTYYDAHIIYAENIGTASSPQFAPGIVGGGGINTNNLDVALPSSADIDGDGDVDVFINDYYGVNIYYYENLLINTEYAPESHDVTLSMEEDELLFFDASNFPFMDGNAGDGLVSVQITSLPTAGQLKLGSVPVTVGQQVVVASLPNLNYQPAQNGNGTAYDSFNFKVSDGALQSLVDNKLTIDVLPVNDAPVTEDAAILATENQAFNFDAGDFPYSDVEGEPLAGISIVSLPNKGALLLGNVPVVPNQNLTLAEIAALKYQPVNNEFGLNYTQFTFRVYDGATYSLPKVMTIDVQEASGTDNRLLAVELQLSPNPATNSLQVTISAENELQSPNVTLMDATGRTLVTQQLSRSAQAWICEFDVSNFAEGMYFVKVDSNGKAVLSKFVKA